MKSYFYVFGIYQEVDLDLVCLSWADTEMWCSLLGLEHVPVIYQGTYRAFDQKKHIKTLDLSIHEGYVIRNTDRFLEKDFDKNVAKWVRANHVQTDEHWMSKKVEKNLLRHE